MNIANLMDGDDCRAPHGARGLKYGGADLCVGSPESRPARGAWIEIQGCGRCALSGSRRAPHGARGLKYVMVAADGGEVGRTPQGVRGLKYGQ